jgi:hypothetical protein
MRVHVLHQNSDVTNATAKFLREGVEHLLRYLGETLTRHGSPTALTPNSRRQSCRHPHILFCRRLRHHHPRRPRLAPAAVGHRQRTIHRGVWDDAFVTYSVRAQMVRLGNAKMRRHTGCGWVSLKTL